MVRISSNIHADSREYETVKKIFDERRKNMRSQQEFLAKNTNVSSSQLDSK